MENVVVQDKFLNFLESSMKYRNLIDVTIQKNEHTLMIDMNDINDHCVDLYVAIVQKYGSMVTLLNTIVETYSIKNFGKKICNVSFYNLDFVYKIRDLKSNKLGQLASFSGTATRTTQVRPELVKGTFTCKDCGTVCADIEQEYRYTEPIVCPNHLCTNRKMWELCIDDSSFANWQRIHVQENTDEIPPGSLPRYIDVIVRNDLVEKVRPGDKLIFTGYTVVVPDIIQLMLPQSKTVPTQEGVADNVRSKRNINIKDLNYKLCFIGVHVDKPNENDSNVFTNEEITAVNNMRAVKNLYYQLSQSLFPSIHGHYSIKNAILLMLVGGTTKTTTNQAKLRGDINILLVGDPGTAKSQFLKQTCGILDRSVYTSGKSSSAAGLTACVVKDGETGEMSIEAGALMLSDNGVCCIDEFDKMNYKDQVSIHEAMEQQTITIAKAGINATLNARTSILAAANPVKGRYDKRKTLKQNINMSQPIMSRFDLYFVLIDDIDQENDTNVSNHIIKNHQMFYDDNNVNGGYFTLEQVKLYIKYVRKLKPKLNENVYKVIIDEYVKMRQDSLVSNYNYKTTVRQLGSIIRLSEALAKLHCDDEVTEGYVLEACRLISSGVLELKGEDVDIGLDTHASSAVTINSRDLLRLMNQFVFLIKTKEGMTREELLTCYIEYVEETLDTVETFYEEKDMAERALDYLINHEGVFFVSDGVVYIHPNYDI